MKHAIVVPATHSYLPGLNAILNALDYYGYEQTAVELLSWDLKPAYLDAAREVFSFPIHVTDINALVTTQYGCKNDNTWRIKFSRWAHAATLMDYDAVAMFGADVLIAANIERWFSLVSGKPLALTAHNVLGTDAFDREAAPHHTNAVPVADFPMICDPRQYREVFAKVWQNGVEFSMGDMPALWFALRECGKLDDVLLLPDNQWLCNHFHATEARLDKDRSTGRLCIYNNLRERVYLVHKKWWNEGHDIVCIRGLTQVLAERTRRNGSVYRKLYRELNENGKLKLSDYYLP